MRAKLLLWLFLLVVTSILCGSASATTFYVSPRGSDGNAGTSPGAPWRTLAKVNNSSLVPGDRVRFEGGQTFVGTLFPSGSGTPAAPIAFDSYGVGPAILRDGIVLVSRNWLTLENLKIDGGDWRTATTRGIFAHDNGSGSSNIVVRNCTIRDVSIGILSSNEGDRNWTVTGNLVQFTRDSGVILHDPDAPNGLGGSGWLFQANRIFDTGLDASITYPKHGVYSKARKMTFRRNTIRNFSDAGISIRAGGNVLRGNTIQGGLYAVNWSPYDLTASTTSIIGNAVSDVSGYAVEINATGPYASTVESFVIASNTVNRAGGGVRLIGTLGVAYIYGNQVTNTSGGAVRVDDPAGVRLGPPPPGFIVP
jgi:hypothetical protein